MDDEKKIKFKVEVDKPTLGQIHNLTAKDIVISMTVETPKEERKNINSTED